MNKHFILIAALALVIAFAGFNNAATSISSCQDLTSANTYYILTTSVSSFKTCMNITADNITLDCNGYMMTYSNTTGGGACVRINGANATVINCKMRQTASINSGYGITVSKDNATIYNNTIITRYISGYGIYSNSSYCNITNNTILTQGSSAHGTYFNSAHYNVFDSNSVNATGGNTQQALYVVNSHNNSFSNSSFKTYASGTLPYAVWFNGALDNNFTNNYVNTLSVNGIGLYLLHSNETNIIDNNVSANTSTAGAYALQLSSSKDNLVVNSEFWSRTSADIYVVGVGENNVTNCTYNKSELSVPLTATGSLNFFWFVRLHTINAATSGDIPTANVNASTVYGVGTTNYTMDINGYYPDSSNWVTINEYVFNSTGVYNYTPHYFNASKTGYLDNNTVFTIDASQVVTIELTSAAANETPSVELISPADGYSTTDTAINLTARCTAEVVLDTLQFWTNVSGSWALNATFTPYVNNTIVPLNLSGLSIGTYSWAVYCNTSTEEVYSANRTFDVTAGAGTPTPYPALTKVNGCLTIKLKAGQTLRLRAALYNTALTATTAAYTVNSSSYSYLTIKQAINSSANGDANVTWWNLGRVDYVNSSGLLSGGAA